jgi:hypothetical protein
MADSPREICEEYLLFSIRFSTGTGGGSIGLTPDY